MIAAAIRKDVWLLLRDRGALISLFLLPIIFITAFGFMFRGPGNDGKPRPIPIWYAPADARGEAVAKVLGDTPGFAPDMQVSADAVRAAVAGERRAAGLIIPVSGPVELSIDLASPAQVRGPLQGALTGVVMRALVPRPAVPPPALVEPKTPPGLGKPPDNLSGFQVTVPGNAVLFGFFIALTVAMSFTVERRTGTWRRLLAAPVPRWKALLGTLVPYYLVGLCQMAFLFGIGTLAFGMQVAGSVAALVALSATVSLTAVSLGLLMASLGGTERQLGGIGSVALLVMGMLGGCMMPRAFMPPLMKTIGLFVPHGWALDGYYAVLVREGTTIADIAPSLGALLAFAIGFAVLGITRFRFER